jgi:hypothetical protein
MIHCSHEMVHYAQNSFIIFQNTQNLFVELHIHLLTFPANPTQPDLVNRAFESDRYCYFFQEIIVLNLVPICVT